MGPSRRVPRKVLQSWCSGSGLDMDPAQRSRKLTKFSSAKYVFPKALMADLRAGLEASVARHLPQARVLYFT